MTHAIKGLLLLRILTTIEDSSPGHESSSDDVGPEIKNFSDDSATVMAVVVVVLVVIIITVIGVIIITVVFILICKRNGKNLLIQIIQF